MGMRALNTFHANEPMHTLTFKSMTTPFFAPPFDAHSFAQLDYVLSKRCFQTSFSSMKSKPESAYDSDHAPIVFFFKFQIARSKGNKPVRATQPKYLPPTAEQIERYNESVHASDLHWNAQAMSIADARAAAFEELPRLARKSWMSAESAALLVERDGLLEHGRHAEAREVTQRYRRGMKADKKKFWIVYVV